jgi:alkanesulfonate monooxygenase SsuD/methylene tetrahydromethanopterin reductase-like flavin-dependent oxidoreductase (luciferase family)
MAKHLAAGRDPQEAHIRIPGLFVTVAKDPERAWNELAPYFLHVNNVYGDWNNEDRALGLEDTALKPMSLEDFKRSGILTILTPDQAIDHFKAMQARVPIDHFMMMLPPGLPPSRFVEYAEVFANEVIPAFR